MAEYASTAAALRHSRLAATAGLSALLLLTVAAGSVGGLGLVYSVDLPPITGLEHYPSNATAELYDTHGHPFESLALEQRIAVHYDDISPLLREAVISVEDKNFERNRVESFLRVAATIYRELTSKRTSASSTFSMQLARTLFPPVDRKAGGPPFSRRLQESYLTVQIENHFTKQQIFTLYANHVYVGHGIYGFEAAAGYYFSKHARVLTLPEAALLGGLPRVSGADTLASNAEKLLRRRNLVINAMLEDGAITTVEATRARAVPLGLHIEAPPTSPAPWFVEEVRRGLEETFRSEQVHQEGRLRVYTTLDLDLQRAADRSVLDGLAAYERRRGWKGHLLNVTAARVPIYEFQHPDWSAEMLPGAYVHGLVTGVLPYQVTARLGRDEILLSPEDWAWTHFSTAEQFLKPGDIVYVHLASTQETAPVLHGTLEQDSGAEGSLLAMDNASGDILAMVGGRDFNMSQFNLSQINRATEAVRQTGSSFKPYVFTAAVEAGARPEQLIDDSPVSFGGYTPRNFDGRFLGRISLLQAFADSRNVPAVKLAERVGIRKVVEVAHRFGIAEEIPAYLPVSLGSVELTLEDQVAAFAAFPNDGVRIAPRLIRRVTNVEGSLLWQDKPNVMQATSVKTARTMMGFFKEVTRSGTASAAAALHHPLAGKTGTTIDFTNAWFIGFSPSITCGTWVGFDSRQPLGEGETGARAALPIWMDFMAAAIAGRPGEDFPGGLKTADPRTADSRITNITTGDSKKAELKRGNSKAADLGVESKGDTGAARQGEVGPRP